MAIWTAMQTARDDAAWRMTWICVGLAVSATLLTELLVRRRRRELAAAEDLG